MSGPKVVRIVSREEMEAIKALHVSHLERVVEDIKRYSEQHTCFTDDQINEIQRRLKNFKNADASEYRRIEAQIPSEINFLKNEKQRAEDRARMKAKSKIERARSLQAACSSLESMYNRRSRSVPESIKDYKASLSSLSLIHLDQMEKDIRESFLALDDANDKFVEENGDYLNRLKQGHESVSFDSWLNESSLKKPTAIENRINALIADLATAEIKPSERVSFTERAAQLFREPENQFTDMKLDSLCIDVNAHIKSYREKLQAYHLCCATLQNLQSISGEVTLEACESISSELTESLEEINSAIKSLGDRFNSSLLERSAESKRHALLSALNRIGYRVLEGMETAYVENGRLVVKRSQDSSYGVELGGPQDLRRMQIRVVAKEGMAGFRSKQSDLDEETKWCDDFSRLKQTLSDSGMLLEIDRQLEPGEAEIKTVEFESPEWESSSKYTKHSKQESLD